jgi:hypothetical protein
MKMKYQLLTYAKKLCTPYFIKKTLQGLKAQIDHYITIVGEFNIPLS